MLDIKFVRENPEVVKQNIRNKFQDQKLELVDKVIELDKENRDIKQEVEALRAKRNKISKQIGALMGQGRREEAEELVALIPTISVEPFHTGRLQELSEHYRSIIGTHSTTDLVEIIKSVYSKKREAEAAGRRVSQLDDRYMKLAEELLHGELSVALDIPKDEVKDYIHRRVAEAEAAG